MTKTTRDFDDFDREMNEVIDKQDRKDKPSLDGCTRRSIMAGIFAAGALAGLGALVGYQAKQDSEAFDAHRKFLPKKPSLKITLPDYDTRDIEGKIAMEMSKWEPWIFDVVETDYERNQKPVILTIDETPASDHPFDTIRAAYDPDADILMLRAHEVKSLDHELAHTLTDHSGFHRLGPLHSRREYEDKISQSIKDLEFLTSDSSKDFVNSETREIAARKLKKYKDLRDGKIPEPKVVDPYTGPSQQEVKSHLDKMMQRPEISDVVEKMIKEDPYNSERIKEYTSTYTERLAFALSSLMKGYTGDKFDKKRYWLPLRDDDLALFERMKLGGKPMFGKAIEKYRLKKEMLKAGHTEEELKDLQYATRVEWNGKTYEFPEPEFRVYNVPKGKE